MKWTIEYFEQADTAQPAEVFGDAMDATHIKLAAKLARIAAELQSYGYQLGGGYIEKCHDYEGMWEIRAIHSGTLARELFGFDGERERIVLLHGYTKRSGEPASEYDLKKAFTYWAEYKRAHRISPREEENNE